MTDGSKQVSVAELLARNGQQVGTGGRRRRGNRGTGNVTVASLTGDLPVIPAEPESSAAEPAPAAQVAETPVVIEPAAVEPAPFVVETVAAEPVAPEPRQVESRRPELPQAPARQPEPRRRTRAERRAAEERAARSFESLLDPPTVDAADAVEAPSADDSGGGQHAGTFDFAAFFDAVNSPAEPEPPQPREAKPAPTTPPRNGFAVGRRGFGATADDAPTEIRLPEITDPTAEPAAEELEATQAWPASPIGVGGPRARDLDDAITKHQNTKNGRGGKNGGKQPSGPSAHNGSPAGKTAGAKPAAKKPPARPSAEDFPTEVWAVSGKEPKLLSGSSVAAELLTPKSERGDAPVQPAPDDDPTDVNHPFFRHRLDDDELARRDAEHAADQAEIKRQWTMLGAQSLAAAVIGVFLFWGFERLWAILPWVALPLAIAVMLSLVAVVRILRRGDDLISLAIALAVGVFVTLGPLPFVLSTA